MGPGEKPKLIINSDGYEELEKSWADSPYKNLPKYTRPLNSATDYYEFVKQLVEILQLAFKLVPCQTISLVKLAVDLMLTRERDVYADLYATFVASLLYFSKKEEDSIEKKLMEANRDLSDEKVQELAKLAYELKRQLEQKCKVFDKFKVINKTSEDDKKRINQQYLSKCSAKTKLDPKDHVNEQFAKLFQSKVKELKYEVFLQMESGTCQELVCSFIDREFQYVQGSNSSSMVIKRVLEKYKEKFEKNTSDAKSKRFEFLRKLCYFESAIESLKEIIVDYCINKGIHHIQAMTILGIYILMATDSQQFQAFLAQMQLFMGEQGSESKFIIFCQKYSQENRISRTDSIGRKICIHLACLGDFGIDVNENSIIEAYRQPLELIGDYKLLELYKKFQCGGGRGNHFKDWKLIEQREFVAKFLLDAILPKTFYLTGVGEETQLAIDHYLQFLESLKGQKNTLLRSSEYSLSDSETGQSRENCGSGQGELNEDNQSEIIGADQVEAGEESDTKRSDI